MKIYHKIAWKKKSFRFSRKRETPRRPHWLGSDTITNVYVTESDRHAHCNSCNTIIKPHTKRVEIEVYGFGEKKFCIDCVRDLKLNHIIESVAQRRCICRCCNKELKKGAFRIQFNVDHIRFPRSIGNGAWVSICDSCRNKLIDMLTNTKKEVVE